jgi:hypothetical protein
MALHISSYVRLVPFCTRRKTPRQQLTCEDKGREVRSCIDGYVCLNSNRRLSFIVCGLRKTNVHFWFPFAVSVFRLQKTNVSCRFPLVLFSVCGIPEHGDMDMETWRSGDMEEMETCRHGDIKQKMENGSPSDFLESVYRLLIMQTEV